MKYYAVAAGRQTGIYTTWDAAKEQVLGFPGAKFQSFSTEADAQSFLAEGGVEEAPYVSKQPVAPATADGLSKTAELTIYSDGSFNPATSRVGSSVVIRSGLKTVKDLHLVKTISNKGVDETRNVGGELVGAMTGIDYAIAKGFKSVEIFYDYQGVGSWADGQWRAKTELAQRYSAAVAARRDKIDIKFTKTTAHVGVAYNELADRLAKYACGADLSAKDATMLQSLDIINLDVEKY